MRVERIENINQTRWLNPKMISFMGQPSSLDEDNNTSALPYYYRESLIERFAKWVSSMIHKYSGR